MGDINYSLDILVDNVDLTLDMFMKREDAVLEAIGLKGVENANKEVTALVYDTPESPNYKRTGFLRNSIDHKTELDSALIGSGAKYAKYVELGTSKMPARPFLRNAIVNHYQDYEKVIKDGFS